ncbi:MAG TPA: DUF6064 family protein [Burkholderiales bacterium]|nr:DUF6064 family protein [Burkholderiales bacterium]
MSISLPFSPEQFFAVFARYNETVWPMPIALNSAALLSIALLLVPGAWPSFVITLILALLWAWMAIAYHIAFFTSINPAAWLLGMGFLLGSLAFAWHGIARPDLNFRFVRGVRGISGAALIVFALVLYPVIGYFLGHRYPAAPTFGLPCPTTIFTLGLLLFAASPLPKAVLLVPLLWAAVGALAAFQLGVYEDLALVIAGVVTIVVMLVQRVPLHPLAGAEVREK